MKKLDRSRPVVITGGSGYLACWIIKMLLQDGINVNATVRDPLDVQKVEHFGDGYPFPRRQAPKSLFWLIAPMYGFSRKYVSRNVGYPIKIDNSYSKADLGMTYIPLEQTVKEHFQQILNDGLLAEKTGSI